MRISKILHFLLPLPFSLSSASVSYCINSLYNCFVSLLLILYVVTIISFFVYDTFKIIVIDYCSFLLLILQILFYLFQTIMVFASHSQHFFESTLIFVSSYQVFKQGQTFFYLLRLNPHCHNYFCRYQNIYCKVDWYYS